jgi:hypothetical protein
VYLSTKPAPSVYVKGATALAMDEAVVLENWVGAGGMISTARALAAFAAAYRVPDGVPLAGATNIGMKDGSLPGVATIVRQLKSGVSYAVMINAEVPGPQYQALVSEMDAAIASAGQ